MMFKKNVSKDSVGVVGKLDSVDAKLQFLVEKSDDTNSTFTYIYESFNRLESKLERLSHRQTDSHKTFVENVLQKLDYLFFDNQITKKQLMIEEDIRWCESEINILKTTVSKIISQINHSILQINEKLPKAPQQQL